MFFSDFYAPPAFALLICSVNVYCCSLKYLGVSSLPSDGCRCCGLNDEYVLRLPCTIPKRGIHRTLTHLLNWNDHLF